MANKTIRSRYIKMFVALPFYLISILAILLTDLSKDRNAWAILIVLGAGAVITILATIITVRMDYKKSLEID